MRVSRRCRCLKASPDENASSWSSDMIVEEVLQDIGILDFGEGISAKANVALWRSRGDHRPLIGEFAFQIKFKRREDLKREGVAARAEAFFLGSSMPRRTGSPSGRPRPASSTDSRAIRRTPHE